MPIDPAKVAEVRALVLDAFASAAPAAPAFAVPPSNHGAFDDLSARLEFIQLGAEALKGLGAMMQPEHGDFQMNVALSSNAAAVFRFFGEALRDPAAEAYTDMERLVRAARGEHV